MKTIRVFMCLSSVGLAMAAEARDARLTGRVLDNLGNAVAEAHVLIIPADPSRPVTSVTSDSGGRWLKEGLQEGIYRLVAAKKGYNTALKDPMSLSRDDDASIELKLAPAQAVSRTRRRDLAWLVRALAGDVLRFTPESETQAGSDWPDDNRLAGDAMLERLGLAIRGQLELASLETGDVDGNSTNLTLRGGASHGLTWELLGQRDERVTHSDFQDAIASDALRYSLSFEPASHGTLLFDGRHKSSELRITGSTIEELATSEDLSSYSMAWIAGSPDDSLRALEFNYSAAETGRGEHSKDRHELFLTRGSYTRGIGENHRFTTNLELSAQSFTRPNGLLLTSHDGAASLPLGIAQLVPASWSVWAAGQYDLQLAPRLRISPGVNLFEVSDAAWGDLVRPHVNLALHITPSLELGSELAVAFAEGFEGAHQYGYGVRLKADVGVNRRLSVALRRNGQGDAYVGPYASLNQTASDFYLVPDGLATTREIVVAFDGGLGELAQGRLQTIVGQAEGDLIVAPRSDQSLDRALRYLRSRRVHYVVTSLGTTWRPTDTDVDLSYQWTDGLAPAESDDDTYARVDLQVRQDVPFLALATTRMQLVFNLRNYFARPELLAQRSPDGLSSLDPASRTISGGVAINF